MKKHQHRGPVEKETAERSGAWLLLSCTALGPWASGPHGLQANDRVPRADSLPGGVCVPSSPSLSSRYRC